MTASPSDRRRRLLPALLTSCVGTALTAQQPDQPATATWPRCSFGGELRERYELLPRPAFGTGPLDHDGYLLQRFRVHGELRLSERVRTLVELYSGIEQGRNGGPRPPDENRADLHQAFVELGADEGRDASWLLRLGRHELQYGSGRLISVREGPNVRRTFDGALLRREQGPWRVDALATRAVRTVPGEFDDGRESTLYGLYATRQLAGLGGQLDLYALGFERDDAELAGAEGREQRRSLGVRLAGAGGGYDYDVEAVWQFGHFDGERITAWTFASDCGHTFAVPWRPRLSLRLDVASGDGRGGARGTFVAMYPRGSYFGEAALLGPSNLVDVHPMLQLAPSEGVRLWADWAWFWRHDADDGIYTAGLDLQRPGTGSRSRYLGNQLQVGIEAELAEGLSTALVWSRFFVGGFLADTGPTDDVDFFAIWTSWKF